MRGTAYTTTAIVSNEKPIYQDLQGTYAHAWCLRLRRARHGMKASLFRVAVVLFALATAIGAQQQPEDDPTFLLHANSQQRSIWANEWLRSGDARRIAWGAWLVRQDGHT